MADRLHRPDGLPPRVLVVGGGVAALEAVLALRALAGMRLDVELIAPDETLRYPPLEVLEPFGGAARPLVLADALAAIGSRQRRERVAVVDSNERVVHTDAGATVPYEALVVAVGALREPPRSGMLTFGGPRQRAELGALLEEAERGRVRSLLFAVPSEAAWPLPLYELALMTAQRLRARCERPPRVALATPERAPLELFGGRASGHVLEQLGLMAIAFHGRRTVGRVGHSEAVLEPGGERVAADRVITLPRLRGPAVPGLPHDADGFLPVDRHGAVLRVHDVYAAGDATDGRIKQGGLATQQADAVAAAIAARAGAPVTPEPYRAVLRGMLLSAAQPQYLEADAEGRGTPIGGPVPLWWPPTKVAGRYLTPFLAGQLGVAPPAAEPLAPWAEGAVPCEVAEVDVGAPAAEASSPPAG